MMTKERAKEIIELHKTVPQSYELLLQAIKAMGQLAPPQNP